MATEFTIKHTCTPNTTKVGQQKDGKKNDNKRE